MRFILFCVLVVYNYTNAQPVIEENFIYPTGTLTVLNTDWIEDPLGSYDVQVIDGNLTYWGYPSSGAGRMIFLDGGSSGRSGIKRSFPMISGNGKKVYVSFLLKMKDTLDLTTAGFFRLKSLDASIKLYVNLQKVTGTNKYKIGISKGGEYFFDPVLRDPGEVYLIVASYQFNTGNDTLKLWIDPDLSGGIPPPALTHCPAVADAANLTSINLSQLAASGNIYIDGLRLDTTWAQAPLPVELTTFSAEVFSDSIIVKWRTETEIENYGFDLERSKYGKWEKIGFIEGHGNCNTPNNYNFLDNEIFNSSEISYRLKQIDTDGSFEYSNEINVKLIPSDFCLFQNFPNPFNPITLIRYNFPAAAGSNEANVKMILYDVLGNVTSVLLNEVESAGRYEYLLDTKNLHLSSGIYFYSLLVSYTGTAAIYSDVKKMILLK